MATARRGPRQRYGQQGSGERGGAEAITAVISTIPRCHLDLPPLSSRPAGEISNRPWRHPPQEKARFLASLRNDNGGGFTPFALPGTTRFLASLEMTESAANDRACNSSLCKRFSLFSSSLQNRRSTTMKNIAVLLPGLVTGCVARGGTRSPASTTASSGACVIVAYTTPATAAPWCAAPTSPACGSWPESRSWRQE